MPQTLAEPSKALVPLVFFRPRSVILSVLPPPFPPPCTRLLSLRGVPSPPPVNCTDSSAGNVIYIYTPLPGLRNLPRGMGQYGWHWFSRQTEMKLFLVFSREGGDCCCSKECMNNPFSSRGSSFLSIAATVWAPLCSLRRAVSTFSASHHDGLCLP